MTAVCHCQHHIRARLHVLVLGLVGFIEHHVGAFDGQRAAVGHRITAVHDKVHDDLLDLSAVRLDQAHIGIEPSDERDIFAD